MNKIVDFFNDKVSYKGSNNRLIAIPDREIANSALFQIVLATKYSILTPSLMNICRFLI